MNRIFIYYSLTGNGDSIAESLKSEGFAIRKVISSEPLPKNKILGILVGGFRAMTNYKDKLDNFDNNIDNYDEIIIGSPIWNDRLCSPINSVLDKLNLNNKSVSFILYSGSGKTKKAIDQINKRCNKNRIILLKEPKNNIEGNKELILRELK